jgi:benzoyl-CoA reductase/2-hydroxyglutaryl-CoA dehydratase subunit BcrC/BadD/HgdB
MKTIIYTCPYVPAEWIAAHGLRASRLLLNRTESDSALARTEGVCPFVRSFVSELINSTRAEGVIVTTVCDQMRRSFDILVRKCELPAFLMNVPSTCQSLESQKMYIDELKRLSRFLAGLGGKPPSNDTLIKIMLEYDVSRVIILAAREHLPGRQFAEALAAFGRSGLNQTINNAKSAKLQTDGIPLAIIGGPLMSQDFALLDVIEQSGGRVVLDATETGERGMCARFNRRRLYEDPLMELADAYFGGIQDASRRPNSGLYEWLKQKLASRNVQGIIFRRYVWCDLWHAELKRLKDWTDLPVLDIDVGGENDNERYRTANRIRAFLEMLQ